MTERGAFSINEWCRWAGIGRTKTYELINDGILPVIKIGGKTLIAVSDGEALLEKFKRSPGRLRAPSSNPEAV